MMPFMDFFRVLFACAAFGVLFGFGAVVVSVVLSIHGTANHIPPDRLVLIFLTASALSSSVALFQLVNHKKRSHTNEAISETLTHKHKVEYGHLHLGFWFKPAVWMDADGLWFRGRHHAWPEITEISQTAPGMEFAVGYSLGKPKVKIVFRDGSILRLDAGSFCKRGERPKAGFLSGISSALKEFFETVERSRKKAASSLDS